MRSDLWNICTEVTNNAFLVCCADDIAVVVVVRDIEDVQRRLNQVMSRVSTRLENYNLNLAAQKTKISVLTKRWIPTNIEVQVGSETVCTK